MSHTPGPWKLQLQAGGAEMTEPRTLRLANILEKEAEKRNGAGDYSGEMWCGAGADELRRLHEVNQKLLNALHCISLAAQDSGSTRDGMGLEARKAIAKAEGK